MRLKPRKQLTAALALALMASLGSLGCNPVPGGAAIQLEWAPENLDELPAVEPTGDRLFGRWVLRDSEAGGMRWPATERDKEFPEFFIGLGTIEQRNLDGQHPGERPKSLRLTGRSDRVPHEFEIWPMNDPPLKGIYKLCADGRLLVAIAFPEGDPPQEPVRPTSFNSSAGKFMVFIFERPRPYGQKLGDLLSAVAG